jgi:hypothetical protein
LGKAPTGVRKEPRRPAISYRQKLENDKLRAELAKLALETRKLQRENRFPMFQPHWVQIYVAGITAIAALVASIGIYHVTSARVSILEMDKSRLETDKSNLALQKTVIEADQRILKSKATALEEQNKELVLRTMRLEEEKQRLAGDLLACKQISSTADCASLCAPLDPNYSGEIYDFCVQTCKALR